MPQHHPLRRSDGNGNVLTSINPTGGATTWKLTNVDSNNFLGNVSCPSASICVAVDQIGNVVTSINPTASTPTWTVTDVDGFNGLFGISCKTTTFCVATDGNGNVVTSTDPGAATPIWTVTKVDGKNLLSAVSCPVTTLCLVTDETNGDVVVGLRGTISVTSPATGASWAPGSSQAIAWSSTGTPGAHVKIELLNAGKFVETIVASVLTTGGIYTWKLPTTLAAGTAYQMKIISTTTSLIFGRSGNFQIT